MEAREDWVYNLREVERIIACGGCQFGLDAGTLCVARAYLSY